LKELIKKYDFDFTIDGERYAAETLSEILDECI